MLYFDLKYLLLALILLSSSSGMGAEEKISWWQLDHQPSVSTQLGKFATEWVVDSFIPVSDDENLSKNLRARKRRAEFFISFDEDCASQLKKDGTFQIKKNDSKKCSFRWNLKRAMESESPLLSLLLNYYYEEIDFVALSRKTMPCFDPTKGYLPYDLNPKCLVTERDFTMGAQSNYGDQTWVRYQTPAILETAHLFEGDEKLLQEPNSTQLHIYVRFRNNGGQLIFSYSDFDSKISERIFSFTSFEEKIRLPYSPIEVRPLEDLRKNHPTFDELQELKDRYAVVKASWVKPTLELLEKIPTGQFTDVYHYEPRTQSVILWTAGTSNPELNLLLEQSADLQSLEN